MLRRYLLSLTACTACVAAVGVVQDHEDFEQPAVIAFQGITERDEVRVDGELVPAKGLALAQGKLMIAPGEYVISMKLAGSGKECVSTIVVNEGDVATPTCSRPPVGQMAD